MLSLISGSIEARIQQALPGSKEKDVKGNEEAGRVSKHASILGHESGGVVTPAGLKRGGERERKWPTGMVP